MAENEQVVGGESIPFAKLNELREAGQQQVTTATAAPAAATGTTAATGTPAEPFDENKWLEQKFQGKFKSFDELTAAVNKQPEVVYKAPEFPNDDSKAVYEALTSGKELEVLPILQKRKTAVDFPTLSDDEKIAAHIRVEYPSLNDSQVKREIERRYQFDSTGMTDEDRQLEETKIKDRKARDAQQATQYFTQNIPEIKLPSAAKPTSQVQQLSDQQKQFFEMGSEFSKYDIGEEFSYEFADQAKNVSTKGKVTLPVDEIAKLEQQIATDPNYFLAGYLDRYVGPDGKVNARTLAKDIILRKDPASWANQIAKQSIEDVYTARLAQERNYQGSGATGSGGVASPEQTEKDRMYDAFRIPRPANGAAAPVA